MFREALQPALERLETFSKLDDDWDSYGAVPISPVAILIARELAADIVNRHMLSIRPPDYSFDVVPAPDGGVQLEWDIGSQHLEIAIDPRGTLSYLLVTDFEGQRQSSKAEGVSRRTLVELAEDMLPQQSAPCS